MREIGLMGVAGAIMVMTVMATRPAAQQPTLTQEEMFRRNVGSREDQVTPFPPHRIVGNLYYVGTNSLSAFLVATPDGHILINTNWERAVDGLKTSVETLGFAFADIKIILGESRARRPHGGRRARQRR